MAGAFASVTAQAQTAAQPHFDVWEYQVAGSQLIPVVEIERAVYPHLGPGRTIDDVEAARAAVEAAFRGHGYGTVVVNIPEQDVAAGLVRLDVLEGRVERLRVTGSRYFSLGRIKAQVPSLAPGTVPALPAVQRELAAANKLSPDRRITPVLRPGRAPGAVEVELEVDDELPLHGSLALDDKYTRDTTRTRLNAALRYDNLWQREHGIGVSFQVTPQDPSEVQVLSATYLFRPEPSDVLVALYGVRSDSAVTTLGGANSAVGVLGKGSIGGARIIKSLPAAGSVFHNLTFGLDYKDFADTVSPLSGGGFETPISYAKFVVAYGGFALKDDRRYQYNLEADFAVRGLGNTEKEFENKRFQAKPNFLFLRGEARHERALFDKAELAVEVSGQIATGPLVSNEQFSLGGAESVRGYVETQALADDAASGRFELRSPPLGGLVAWRWLANSRAIAFVDAAHGRIGDPLPGQDASFSLAGTGIGLRLAPGAGLSSMLDWAVPLIDNGDIRSGEGRLHFSFEYAF